MRDARRVAEKLAEPADPDDLSRTRLTPPDWAALAEMAEEIARHSGVPLEAAALLTEALTRDQGFAGLAAGTGLIAGLIDQRWDAILAAGRAAEIPADEQLPEALAPLRTLADSFLPGVLRETPLFVTSDDHPYSFGAIERAGRRKSVEASLQREQALSGDRRRPAMIAKLLATLESPEMKPWDSVALDAQTNQSTQIATVLNDLRTAQTAWGRLEQTLSRRDASGIVPFGPIRELLASILATLTPLAPTADQTAGETETGDEADGGATAAPVFRGGGGPALNRQAALDALLDIARFFRATEPQAPIAAAIEDIVRRSRLTFLDLLAEAVPKKEERDAMLLRLGVKPPP
jgi:type VI secretion system protein ImpA